MRGVPLRLIKSRSQFQFCKNNACDKSAALILKSAAVHCLPPINHAQTMLQFKPANVPALQNHSEVAACFASLIRRTTSSIYLGKIPRQIKLQFGVFNSTRLFIFYVHCLFSSQAVFIFLANVTKVTDDSHGHGQCILEKDIP